MVIHILTGPVHSGKTTLLKNTIPLLEGGNFGVDGYLSESVWKNDECLGYDLLDLKEQRSYPFITRKGKENWEKIGSYSFVPESLSRAKKIIYRASNSDLAVVDEVGPLELAGKGVWPALAKTLFFPRSDFILVMRETILKDFLFLLKKSEVLVYTVAEEKKSFESAESLRAEIEKRRKSLSP